MSADYDYWDTMCGICELCGYNKCPTHEMHYEEVGADKAIEVKENCIHMQRVKEMLRCVTEYKVEE